MRPYLNIINRILTDGKDRPDRTGTGVRSLFGMQERFDLAKGFPAITTKRLAWKTALRELLWFIQGTDKCDYLDSVKCTVWKEWTDPETNSVGPMYGVNLRHWETPEGREVDQLNDVLKQLKDNPYSRRHVMTTWNPSVLPDESISPIENVKQGRAALASCHGVAIQFYVEDLTLREYLESLEDINVLRLYQGNPKLSDGVDYSKADMVRLICERYEDVETFLKDSQGIAISRPLNHRRLSCSVYIRSSDVMLGLPFNIAQYAYLTCMLAKLLDYQRGELVVTLGDTHIYANHLEQAKLQVSRTPEDSPYLLIKDTGQETLEDFKEEDFNLLNYHHQGDIPMTVSV